MPKPPIHVFVGAGPANLHRALALRHVDPDAKFIFVDKRLNPDNQDQRLVRDKARANIFRFETDEVTERLKQEGVNASDLEPLVFEREFNPPSGRKPVFQVGDERVFSDKKFTQIQIRDLQLLLLKSIENNSKDNAPLFIRDNLDEPLTEKVQQLVHQHAARLKLDASQTDVQNIHIHLAIGAVSPADELSDEAIDDARNKQPGQSFGDKKDVIIYPNLADQDKPLLHLDATSDLRRMIETPVHGTVTFKINPSFLPTLRDNQISLDEAAWQAPLAKFGWNQIRPPRIRVFYANDILYIGAELPISLYNEQDNANYEQQVTQYTRQIGELVFPNLAKDIQQLPVNTYLRSRFPILRGQRGRVLKIERMDPSSGQSQQENITTYYHGDSRYLPHYQTGSGFVTAFKENELYVAIYQQTSIENLLNWLYAQPNTHRIAPQDRYTIDEVIRDFSSDLGPDVAADKRVQYALEAFKAEVFKQRSLEIIEQNQEKVGRYFNAISTQTLQQLTGQLDTLLQRFNHYSHHHLELNFADLKPEYVTISLLSLANVKFLREQMPKLLNIDFSQVDDTRLLVLRDMVVENFKFSLAIDDIALKTNLDPHDLCQNYETLHNPVIKQAIKTSIDEVKTKIVREVLTHFTQHGVFFKFFSFFFHKTAANIKLAEDIIDKIDKQPGYSFDEIKNTLLAIQPEQVGQAGFKKALQQIKNELIAEVSHQPTRS